MKQAISLPKSSNSIVYEQMGYVDSFDAVVNRLHAYLIYKETRTSNGKWVVRIKGSASPGATFDPESRSLEAAIQKTHAHGKQYLVWGFNLVPKDEDPRLVENRLFLNNEGEPTKIELHLVTRNPEGAALEKKIETVDWPVT